MWKSDFPLLCGNSPRTTQCLSTSKLTREDPTSFHEISAGRSSTQGSRHLCQGLASTSLVIRYVLSLLLKTRPWIIPYPPSPRVTQKMLTEPNHVPGTRAKQQQDPSPPWRCQLCGGETGMKNQANLSPPQPCPGGCGS